MSFEYAPRGFVGLLTPQANTTVEPECQILLPSDMGVINARLTSNKPVIEERLVDYFDTLHASLAQFADAPLRAVGVACTGSSYLYGKDREDALFQALSKQQGAPVTCSALAVVDALQTLEAKRIGLVSPYPDSLLARSVAYWQSRGFAVTAVAKVVATKADHARYGSTHPVYALGSKAALASLQQLRGASLDAIVMLGTGMPSLKSILEIPVLDGAPVISCTLALAWRCALAAQHQPISATSLRQWIHGTDWKARWQARCSVA